VNRFRSNFILALSALFSLMAGLYPFEFADGSRARGVFPWGFVAALMVPFEALRLRDFLQNIVYFLPWGVLVFVFVGSSRSRGLTKVILAALLGGVLSLAIELTQVFFCGVLPFSTSSQMPSGPALARCCARRAA
jgi:hypothetical protein